MAKFIPWFLLPEQKEHRAAVANDLIQTATNEPDFLKKVITGDESWVYGYDLETKAQSSQWKLPGFPCPKKVKQSCSKIKTILTVFFDWEGVIHHEYTPPGQTINQEYYLFFVLLWLRDAISQKWPQLLQQVIGRFIMITSAYASHLVQSFW